MLAPCRLAPGLYTVTANVSLVNGTNTVLANLVRTTTITVGTLPPVIVLARSGTQWLVPSNKSILIDGTSSWSGTTGEGWGGTPG